MKISVVSPANIAFIKYWGRKNEKLFIPRNNNISMTMDGCLTTATVQTNPDLKEDVIEVKYYGEEYKKLESNSIKQKNLFDQVARIRKDAGKKEKVFIRSENNFPSDAGIAASASSFSALTAALLIAYGLEEKFLDKKELSRQIRFCGSGSAVRSAYGGFVEFKTGKSHKESYAEQIADENHWKLVDIVAVVDPEKKHTSSSRGHLLTKTCPYYETRIKEMQRRIKWTKDAIIKKDFEKLGYCIEQDSTSMHAVMMTSDPPIYYWNGGTMKIMQEILFARQNGLQCYFTIDAGPNVHVICEEKNIKRVQKLLHDISEVQFTIVNRPCLGVRTSNKHLF
ncbi:diphosphomevalonate decarboxylase [Candidatus Woesebacteria bacterium]|nr:MAG: diphosphomevalonate decarboxylase [Candidatus Woesebacteria bacterium]